MSDLFVVRGVEFPRFRDWRVFDMAVRPYVRKGTPLAKFSPVLTAREVSAVVFRAFPDAHVYMVEGDTNWIPGAAPLYGRRAIRLIPSAGNVRRGETQEIV